MLNDQYIESWEDKGNFIVHFTDNQAVESIMEKSSWKPWLQQMAKEEALRLLAGLKPRGKKDEGQKAAPRQNKPAGKKHTVEEDS